MENYQVNLWSCYPGSSDAMDDTESFNDLDDAEHVYENPLEYFDAVHPDQHDELWVEILYPDGKRKERLVVKNNKKDADYEYEWRREQAMEAGMLHGIDAYNEVLGY